MRMKEKAAASTSWLKLALSPSPDLSLFHPNSADTLLLLLSARFPVVVATNVGKHFVDI